jgi:hypothetical protein
MRLWKKTDGQPRHLAVVNCWKYLIFIVEYCLDHGDFLPQLKKNIFLKFHSKRIADSFFLNEHWFTCRTALPGFKIALAISTSSIKMETIP